MEKHSVIQIIFVNDLACVLKPPFFHVFSRYFETSYYAKELHAGATVEGNLIFSQESYLPRSAMVNLSVNVFGENLNLLELGGRAEGFEPLVEGLFGPGNLNLKSIFNLGSF